MSQVPASAQPGPAEPAATRLVTDAFDRVAESVPQVLDGLSVAELAWQPGAGDNSIGWLVWHLARVEDAQIAPLGDRDQVLEEGWSERLGAPYAHGDTGYGHTPEQVAAFTVSDAATLAGYYAAVHDQTLAVVGALTADDYARIVDRRWDPPVTCAVRIISVLDDVARHIGQAQYVRGLLERR